MTASASPNPRDRSTQRQKQAQWVLVGYGLFLALVLLSGIGPVMMLAFPASSLAVGLFLYYRAPALYISFALWLLFLGPLIRRLIDYRAGYLTFGPWIFTSLAVTSISTLTLLRHLPRLHKQGGLPYLFCAGALVYGLLISVVLDNPISGIINAFLAWFAPVVFGFHLLSHWRDYPHLQRIVYQTFLGGVLVMGVYGVVQFLVAPGWEVFWLENASASSFGTPEPLGIRVSSTLNSPQAFATVMMVGLILLFSAKQTLLYFPAALFGGLSFLLSMARAVWLSSVVAIPILLTSVKPKLQMRLFLVIALTGMLLVPLISLDQFSEVIAERFNSFLAGQSDVSVSARLSGYNQLLSIALSQLMGTGLVFTLPVEATSIGSADGSILPALFSFGWFGTAPYLVGVFLLLFELFRSTVSRFDPFNSACRAIVVGIFSQVAFNHVFIEAVGMMFWAFLSLGIAANRFYAQQRVHSMGSVLFQERALNNAKN